jgi:hypothetical protein
MTGVIEKVGLNRLSFGLVATVVSGAASVMPLSCRYYTDKVP